jgi:hypothetical protein
MIMELYIPLIEEQELNNTIGKLLCLPEWFSGVEVEVDGYGTAGYKGSYYEPEEYPELVVNDYKITKVYNENGTGVKLTTKQANLVDTIIDKEQFEDYCWSYLEANQEDVGDY